MGALFLKKQGIIASSGGGGGGTPAGIIFDDEFDEVSNTTLENHTPVTGVGWTRSFESTAFAAGLQCFAGESRARPAGSNNSEGTFYTANISGGYPSANYEVLVDMFNPDSADDYSFMGARASFSGANGSLIEGYFAEYTTDASTLWRVSAGSWTLLDTGVAVVTGSQLELIVNGTAIDFYDDGVLTMNATDSTHTLAGEGGIGAGSFRLGAGDESLQRFVGFQINDLG